MHSKFGKALAYSLVCIGMLFAVFPLIWVFVFAFLPDEAMATYPPQLTPNLLYWNNFEYMINRTNIVLGMTNSFRVVLVAVLFVVFFSSFGAYGIARGSAKLRKIVYVILLMTQMIPPLTNMIPIYRILQSLNLLNTRFGLTLVYTATNLPLIMLILIGFYRNAVLEVEEAAMIDGCNWFDIFWRVSLPMSKPGLVSAVIFTFALSWNEFMMAMLLNTNQKFQTFQVTLYNLLATQVQLSGRFGVVTAAAIAGLIPILIVYAIFQKGFIEGVSAGSIK
ncbi:MAG: carbohydrate ABC transporter permease [Oscillospiraceae bacterium]|nr:carbohydrate ABC transporter permease [Oscillospiraceae bacterium]